MTKIQEQRPCTINIRRRQKRFKNKGPLPSIEKEDDEAPRRNWVFGTKGNDKDPRDKFNIIERRQ